MRWLLKDESERAHWPAAREAYAAALAYEARDRRFARRVGLRAAARAHEDAIEALHQLCESILDAPAHSRVALAVKGRAVKAWGKPEWWSSEESHADSCERFAARMIDRAIEAAG